MVVGAYGKILHKPFGAPIRLHLPWKYGFKSIKSIVRIEFTENRPVSFWEELNPNEYGFWANVNPKVNHPRWSQERERVLGGAGETIPTKIFNGYGAEVAHLYKNLESSAFAWLAMKRDQGKSIPKAYLTGARCSRKLGTIYR